MRPPGHVRDAIFSCFKNHTLVLGLKDIYKGVEAKLGDVAQSSIRSYLQLNTPARFERVAHGKYRLKK